MQFSRNSHDHEGLATFQDFQNIMMQAGEPQQILPGGSRGSKAPKIKKEDEDDDTHTTVMLRNIPNKYTRGMLIEQLHRSGFQGDIDYLYLPVDFVNRCNVGYCFLNFRTPMARARFGGIFDGVAAQSCLPGFNSYKVCQVTRAKWQGRDENVRRLRSGPELMVQLAAHPEWLPLLLDEEGVQEPFLVDGDIAVPNENATPSRRQARKRAGQLGGASHSTTVPAEAAGTAEPWTLGLHGLLDGLPGDGCGSAAGCSGACQRASGGYAARGRAGGRGAQGAGDRGAGRRRRGGGRGPGSGVGFMPGLGSYGAAGAMPVPVMTDQGVQYVPYEAAYGEAAGNFYLAYTAMAPDQQVYGMPLQASYSSLTTPGSCDGDRSMGCMDVYSSAPGAWPRPPGQKGDQLFGGDFGSNLDFDGHYTAEQD
mmetsp:Transcript_126184/g.252059  ORF Transcript_126184/g.252059 Transcript_126184/m.252059 type:complete len:422 (-) Transcript_126184:92-1357(-)